MKGQKDEGPPVSDADLESLLARRRLSDPRHERIIGEVLSAVSANSVRRPWWSSRLRWPAMGVALAGTFVAVAFAIAPRPWRRHEDGWRSRGGDTRGAAASFALDVGCSGGALDRCPLSSTLIFRAQVPPPGGFLYAYADPVTPGMDRIWYFTGLPIGPTEPGHAPGVLRQGISVGPEHRPGPHHLHLRVTRRILARAELAAAPTTDTLVKHELKLEVVP